VTGATVPLMPAARRPGDSPVLVADASLARDSIGFKPRFSDLDTMVATAWQARVK
jgi:UDP-glucose 4-epimerase